MSVVVDTNVAMVASRLAPQADDRCVAACMRWLAEIMADGGLLLDEAGLILREYTSKLGFSGQPGAGHAFVRWAHTQQAIPSMVRRVSITLTSDHGSRMFVEFPNHPDLAEFDRSDQKFVAVAVASREDPAILVAIERGWWRHRQALTSAGVNVDFLCPQHAPSRRRSKGGAT